jgi:acetyl esterase/lipase
VFPGAISGTKQAALDHVTVTLFASEKFDMSVVNSRARGGGKWGKHHHHAAPKKPLRNLRAATSVVLFLHGGGWISHFKYSDSVFLSHWANACHVPFLSVDYSLAPENGFPKALNECYAAYKWLCDGGMGIIPKRIIVSGASNGGNMAAALCIRCIQENTRIPDALFLAYPILNMRSLLTSSRNLFMMDTIVPMHMLLQARSVYLPSQVDAERDPLVSPICVDAKILARFPRTSIMVGSLDPFLDDSVDMAHRLTAAGVPTRFQMLENLPHSFLNLSFMLPEAQQAVELFSKWLRADLRL